MLKTSALALIPTLATALACSKEQPAAPPPTPPPPAAPAPAAPQPPPGSQAAPAGMAQGAAAMQEAMKAMNNAMGATPPGGAKVEPVSFRDLKGLLPEEVAGFKRKEAGGEKAGAMGMVMSTANGRYEGPGGGRIDLKITDIGSMAGPMALGLAAWSQAEIDRETETGYEKTTTMGGNRAWEKYDSRGKYGEVKVFVAGRFIVEATGHDLKMEDLKAVVGKLDLAKLAGMK
jgi:hypothetical protein